MKAYLIITSFLCGLLASCVKTDATLAETGIRPQECRVNISIGIEEPSFTTISRRQATGHESRIEDVNLYAVNTASATVEHLFISGSTTTSLTIPVGTWELYAIANNGSDLGRLNPETIAELRIDMPVQGISPTDAIPMAGSTTIDLTGNTSVTLNLQHMVARVQLDISAASDIADRLQILSVQALDVPSGVYCFADDRWTESITWPTDESAGANDFSNVYYLPENLAGTSEGIASPEERIPSNAPNSATVFRITAIYDGMLVYYHVYPGSNDTSDFNIRRNGTYTLDVTIFGANPEDLRVTTCDLWLTEQFDNIRAGQSVPVDISFEAENSTGIEYTISYRVLSGGARITVGGTAGTSGTIAAGLTGSAISRNFGVSVECPQEGPVAVEFTVTDSRGGSITRLWERTVLPVQKITISVILEYGHKTEAKDAYQSYLMPYIGIKVEASHPLPAPLSITCSYLWQQRNSNFFLPQIDRFDESCTFDIQAEEQRHTEVLLSTDKSDAAIYHSVTGFSRDGNIIIKGIIKQVSVPDAPPGYIYSCNKIASEHIGPEVSL